MQLQYVDSGGRYLEIILKYIFPPPQLGQIEVEMWSENAISWGSHFIIIIFKSYYILLCL